MPSSIRSLLARMLCSASYALLISLAPVQMRQNSSRKKPRLRTNSIICECSAKFNECSPTPHGINFSFRFATIALSSWRRLPAAALRGFENRLSPFAARSSFSASKSLLAISVSPRISILCA